MHYLVLVVTDECPQKRMIAEALDPFHNAPDHRFRVDVDMTAQAVEEYAMKHGAKLRSPDGHLHDRFDEAFYREPTAEEDMLILKDRGWKGVIDGKFFLLKAWSDGFLAPRVRFVPEGWEEVPVLVGNGADFAQFCQEKYDLPLVESWAQDDENWHEEGFVSVGADGAVIKVVVRAAAAAHWDWYEIGGRFSGIIPHKDGGDSCRRSSIDVGRLLEEDEKLRRKVLSELALKAGTDFSGMEDILQRYRLALEGWMRSQSSSWEDYYAFIEHFDQRLVPVLDDIRNLPLIKEGQTLDEYCHDGFPVTAFALVMDGQWLAAEAQPFWRMKAGAVQNDDWARRCWGIIRDLPETRWLTVVDCHN